MVAGIFHVGSGLGNQLFRYVATRVLAMDKGYKWGMINSHLFKGDSFMKIDKGVNVAPLETGHPIMYQQFFEKKIEEAGVDVRGYDPEINFVEDNMIIDGEFQDPRYFEHRLNEIREWLKVEPLDMSDDLCVIGFRGGEYTLFSDLFLTKEYWDNARKRIIQEYPGIRFEVHTDDPETARKFFPIYPIIHDIGLNWRSVRYARYLIIANSSFYILPSLLNQDVRKIIAPHYWARRNTKIWALPQNYYRQFTYI